MLFHQEITDICTNLTDYGNTLQVSHETMKQCFFAIDLGATSGRTILGCFTPQGLEIEEINRFPTHGAWILYASAKTAYYCASLIPIVTRIPRMPRLNILNGCPANGYMN